MRLSDAALGVNGDERSPGSHNDDESDHLYYPIKRGSGERSKRRDHYKWIMIGTEWKRCAVNQENESPASKSSVHKEHDLGNEENQILPPDDSNGDIESGDDKEDEVHTPSVQNSPPRNPKIKSSPNITPKSMSKKRKRGREPEFDSEGYASSITGYLSVVSESAQSPIRNNKRQLEDNAETEIIEIIESRPDTHGIDLEVEMDEEVAEEQPTMVMHPKYWKESEPAQVPQSPISNHNANNKETDCRPETHGMDLDLKMDEEQSAVVNPMVMHPKYSFDLEAGDFSDVHYCPEKVDINDMYDIGIQCTFISDLNEHHIHLRQEYDKLKAENLELRGLNQRLIELLRKIKESQQRQQQNEEEESKQNIEETSRGKTTNMHSHSTSLDQYPGVTVLDDVTTGSISPWNTVASFDLAVRDSYTSVGNTTNTPNEEIPQKHWKSLSPHSDLNVAMNAVNAQKEAEPIDEYNEREIVGENVQLQSTTGMRENVQLQITLLEEVEDHMAMEDFPSLNVLPLFGAGTRDSCVSVTNTQNDEESQLSHCDNSVDKAPLRHSKSNNAIDAHSERGSNAESTNAVISKSPIIGYEVGEHDMMGERDILVQLQDALQTLRHDINDSEPFSEPITETEFVDFQSRLKSMSEPMTDLANDFHSELLKNAVSKLNKSLADFERLENDGIYQRDRLIEILDWIIHQIDDLLNGMHRKRICSAQKQSDDGTSDKIPLCGPESDRDLLFPQFVYDKQDGKSTGNTENIQLTPSPTWEFNANIPFVKRIEIDGNWFNRKPRAVIEWEGKEIKRKFADFKWLWKMLLLNSSSDRIVPDYPNDIPESMWPEGYLRRRKRELNLFLMQCHSLPWIHDYSVYESVFLEIDKKEWKKKRNEFDQRIIKRINQNGISKSTYVKGEEVVAGPNADANSGLWSSGLWRSGLWV